MKKKGILIILALVVLAVLAVLGLRKASTGSSEEGGKAATTTDSAFAKYENAELEFAFAYPSYYQVVETDSGTPQRARKTVMLVTKEDYGRMTRGEMSEGPTAITFDFYQNDVGRQSLAQWVTGTNDSNYKLPPDEPYASTTVEGKEGLVYEWQGLYNGVSIVFEHAGNIVHATMSYDSPDSVIVEDFYDIMGSLDLDEFEGMSREDAIRAAQDAYPELKAYPSEGLPPRFVNASEAAGGWNLSFETRGSGVPYILEALCYRVASGKAVTKTGEYRHAQGTDGADKLDSATCKAEG